MLVGSLPVKLQLLKNTHSDEINFNNVCEVERITSLNPLIPIPSAML